MQTIDRSVDIVGRIIQNRVDPELFKTLFYTDDGLPLLKIVRKRDGSNNIIFELEIDNTINPYAKSADVTEEINQKIASLGTVFEFKGIVDTVADLPNSDNKAGDVYYVRDVEAEYVYIIDGSTGSWEELGPIHVATADYAEEANYANFAKEIAPISEESGTTQDEPFISQGTGTANNSASVDTSPAAKLLEKQGNTVVENQLLTNGDFSDGTTDWGSSDVTSFSVSNNVGTFTAAAQNGRIRHLQDFITGQKYLVKADVNLTTATTSVVVRAYNGNDRLDFATASKTGWQTVFGIVTFTSAMIAGEGNIQVRDHRSSGWDAIQVTDIEVRSLTQHFGSNDAIPADLLSNPSHWSWYYNGDGSHNTGTMKNADGRYLVCTERNLFDQQTELVTYEGTSRVTSKNYIRVVPNRQHYIRISSQDNNGLGGVFLYDINKTQIGFIYGAPYYVDGLFTAPANCYYIKFYLGYSYGTTYKNDVTVSLYYSPEQGGEGYSEHYSYEEPRVYDTGTENLLAFDTKDPDGTRHKNTGKVVDLSSLTWGKYEVSTGVYAWSVAISDMKLAPAYTGNPKAKATNYLIRKQSDGNVIGEGWITSNSPAMLYIFLDQGTTPPSGSFEYELADDSKTTLQGTTFSEDIAINDYGMMYWLDDDNNLVGIPQGCKVQYPPYYVGFLDTLTSYTEGDPTSIVVEDDIADAALNARGYYKMEDLSSEITLASDITATVKKAYKIGNQVFITVIAKNETGNELSSFAPLLSLGSGLYNASYTIALTPVQLNDENTMTFARVRFDGTISLKSPLPNGTAVYLNLTYAVA